MDAMKIANSTPMWVACGLAVLLVMIQSIVFTRQAYKAGPKVGLTNTQLKKAVKSSALTAIGPSLVVLSGMLSLLITVGGPMAWMRLSFIGSVMFESIAAGIGTSTVGVQLGVDPMTETALTMAVWTMIVGSIGWIIIGTFSADKMDRVQSKISGGNPAKLAVISSAAIVGLFAGMTAQKLVTMNKNALACILGAGFMALLMYISDKKNIAWLKDWNLTIAIFASLLITALI